MKLLFIIRFVIKEFNIEQYNTMELQYSRHINYTIITNYANEGRWVIIVINKFITRLDLLCSVKRGIP